MKLSSWEEKCTVKLKSNKGKATFLGNSVNIKLNKNYSIVCVAFKVTEFERGKYIDVNLDINRGNCICELYGAWFKGGTEVYKEYIKSNGSIIPYEDSDTLEISLLVRGGDCGEASVRLNSVSQSRKTERRHATVAALGIFYGFESEHRKRTCEDNLNDSLIRIDRLCENCKPDVITLTETFYSRNIFVDDYESSCLSIDSPQVKRIRDKAKEHGIYIAFSIREKDENDGLHNAAILVDRNGDIAAHYNKVKLTINEKLAGYIPGDKVAVIDTDFGRVGIAICWDLYYPEYVAELMKRGVRIILNPTAGYNKQMCTQRALDNGVYIVTAGVYSNAICIINPNGEIIADGSATGSAIAEIDLDQCYPIRMLSVSSAADRRNIFYNESHFE